MFERKPKFIFLENGFVQAAQISYLLPSDTGYILVFNNGDRIPVTRDVARYIEIQLGRRN